MNKQDYIAQVNALRASDTLKARITALSQEKKHPRKRRWLPVCAALTVIIAGGGFWAFHGGMGGNSGGAGHVDGSSVFMSYAGPVFPLTTLESSTLTAQRNITLDFEPWVPVWWSNEEEAASRTDLTADERQDVLDQYNEWYPEGGRYQSSSDLAVVDNYLLTNSTDVDETVTLLYPFAGSLINLSEVMPTMTIDGTAAETTLHIGGYSGGFQSAFGSDDTDGELVNLDQLNSWEEYKVLLSDGTYLQRALGDYPDLSSIPATVYTFTNAWGPEEDERNPNPSIRVTFHMDYEKTAVLSYGFHMGYFDAENNVMGQGFSIRHPGERGYGEPYYLIVVGDDVTGLETQGYNTGGWDTTTTVEYGVDITRYETSLDTALREVLSYYFQELQEERLANSAVSFEEYYGLFCDHLTTYGVLSDRGAARYQTGWLEDLDIASVDRVFYLESTLTIPAGSSISLEASFRKKASYDYHCAHTQNQGVNAYDMVTGLGSSLTFTSQKAQLLDRGQIDIVRQNFGFDLEAGITLVDLDIAQEHYYLEVRRKSAP